MRDRAAAASDGVRDRAAASERQSNDERETEQRRVRNRAAELLREWETDWPREWENRAAEKERERERKKERKRAVRELGSARVLELGFNKITILPLKMSKLTKQAFLCFGPVFKYRPVQLVFAGLAGTRPVWPVFLQVWNIGVNHTGLPAGMVWNWQHW